MSAPHGFGPHRSPAQCVRRGAAADGRARLPLVRLAALVTVAATLLGCTPQIVVIRSGPVMEIGPTSGADRLAAAQAAPGPAPVVVPLPENGSYDPAEEASWPDPCTLLTHEQVQAIVPGEYALVVEPRPTYGALKPHACDWQLGGGATGSELSVSLVIHGNPAAARSFDETAAEARAKAQPVYEGLPDGTRCALSLERLYCQHGNWTFYVGGLAHNPYPKVPGSGYDHASPELQEKWLVPVASLVGPVLAG